MVFICNFIPFFLLMGGKKPYCHVLEREKKYFKNIILQFFPPPLPPSPSLPPSLGKSFSHTRCTERYAAVATPARSNHRFDRLWGSCCFESQWYTVFFMFLFKVPAGTVSYLDILSWFMVGLQTVDYTYYLTISVPY